MRTPERWRRFVRQPVHTVSGLTGSIAFSFTTNISALKSRGSNERAGQCGHPAPSGEVLPAKKIVVIEHDSIGFEVRRLEELEVGELFGTSNTVYRVSESALE